MTTIKTKMMTIDDFIKAMSPNENYYPEYAQLSEQDKRLVAKINLDTGIAESHFLDGKLIGVTGIRERGIGEAWFVVLPEIRNEHKFLLFRQTKLTLPRLRDAMNLWRLYATSRISENFLLHLDFENGEKIFKWTRTE